MDNKIKMDINRLNQSIIHPNRLIITNHSATKYKVLPYLKNYNCPEAPLDYRLYEKLKKHKRMHLIKEDTSNLYLEGEIAYSAPTHHKRHNPDNLIEMLTINRKEKRDFRMSKHRIFHQTKNNTIRPRQQAAQQEANYPPPLPAQSSQKQQAKSALRQDMRKIPSNHSTLQTTVNSNYSKKINEASNNKSYPKLPESSDIQKPIISLDKKQISHIKAESFIVMEYPSMKIITGNRFKKPAEIASLTKIMTFYTVYQIAVEKNIDIESHRVTVDEQAAEMTGTTAELIAGDVLTVEQLLYGLMLPSGNDAALALAAWGGKLINTDQQQTNLITVFISQMNKYAKNLNLKQSLFGNPHGLPNYKNSSNPYDLAILIGHCLKIPIFVKIITTKSLNVWITNQNIKKELIWENTNKLLRRNGFIGVKTGVTVTAGPCLATCYERDDKKFIVVLLRTNKLSRRFKQTRLILGWSLRKYNHDLYHKASKQILKHDAILDSDNSEDEEEFKYQKMDASEFAKRNKILVNEL